MSSSATQKAALGTAAPYALGDFSTNVIAVCPPNAKLELITLPGGGQAQNITVYLRDGGQEGPFSLAVGVPICLSGQMVSRVVGNSGVSSSVLWAISPIDAPKVFAASPPLRSPGASLTATFQAVPVELIDEHGVAYQDYTSGTAAPCSGIARFVVQSGNVTPSITVSDGTNTETYASGNANWNLITFNVVKGTTYTVAGAAPILILGSKGRISPS